MQEQQTITSSKVIGVSTPRIDGPLKTTGAAMYTSDHQFPDLVFAWPVTATVSSGTVQKINTSTAEKMAGVVAIYTHANIGRRDADTEDRSGRYGAVSASRQRPS